jgi:hypothetical protein
MDIATPEVYKGIPVSDTQSSSGWTKYSQIKKAIKVFRLYGISLLGKRKFENLYLDQKMDRIAVQGLIFELELALDKELNDEEAYALAYPAAIVEKLLDLP